MLSFFVAYLVGGCSAKLASDLQDIAARPVVTRIDHYITLVTDCRGYIEDSSNNFETVQD